MTVPRERPSRGTEHAPALELANFGVLHVRPEERFDRVALLARQAFEVAGAGIAMQDGDHSFLKAATGLAALDSAEAETLARFAVSHSDLKVIDGVSPDAGFGMLEKSRPIRFYAGLPVLSAGGTRVGTLFLVDHRSRTFSERDEKLLADLLWLVERELWHTAELDQAAEVQRKLMPEHPPHVPGYEFAAACVPCRGVGGDFFDWYHTDRGVVMTLGDVMGKGIGAAIVMSAACSVLRAAGRQYPPAQAVEFADLALREELESTATMITVCQGELTPETGVVRYVDAGHGLMCSLLADGTVRRPPPELKSLPLGVLPDEKRAEIAMRLMPGDTAFIFSDGLLDLYDSTADPVDAIAQAARAVADRGPQAIVDHFVQRALEHARSDDVTVCAYRRSASG
ncbi:MAG TPA: SpoIIE family protein phosphatase [Actinophytocola sp.]|uniref:PP2C family protein-serine/threonine phosphatase n=1 Tax=Actinophytocola sp. TaxID=1872138 RepID=UPI002DB5B67C|nr:SpoIIE family protein phosphatase [Actinophytocola sp.]HEU5472443.1 SpoIIE family protein phosphatase [Actinophytocola sp.]